MSDTRKTDKESTGLARCIFQGNHNIEVMVRIVAAGMQVDILTLRIPREVQNVHTTSLADEVIVPFEKRNPRFIGDCRREICRKMLFQIMLKRIIPFRIVGKTGQVLQLLLMLVNKHADAPPDIRHLGGHLRTCAEVGLFGNFSRIVDIVAIPEIRHRTNANGDGQKQKEILT